jgi:hypothetical protein
VPWENGDTVALQTSRMYNSFKPRGGLPCEQVSRLRSYQSYDPEILSLSYGRDERQLGPSALDDMTDMDAP